MKSISNILRDVYQLEWVGLNILECGANMQGEETSSFENENNCWYVEASLSDYNVLKQIRKNTLNLALSDKNGKITFTVSSHVGNSSCEYSEEHLEELKKYNTKFTTTEVECISYESLLEKLNLVFDVFVLDIEGHEKTVLNSWKSLDKKSLPSVLVIECGYDWNERLTILKELGYNIDCYYFNNCYLSNGSVKTNLEHVKNYNNEWKTFVWNNKVIYVNELI
jgi:FkbM family methyltransferase